VTHPLAITNRRDTTVVTASRRVVIGVDTHLDTNHLAVIADAGKPVADAEFPTSLAGYDDAVRWAQSFGSIVIAGVEGGRCDLTAARRCMLNSTQGRKRHRDAV
jgi:hypothetical protein